jgi:hypothetical protein
MSTQNSASLAKIQSQSFVTIASLMRLETPNFKNQTAEIALNTVENFLRLMSFSDLDLINGKGFTPSIVGAIAMTGLTLVDDIAIKFKLYDSHHLAKLGSAGYIGYRLSDNEDIGGGFSANINTFFKSAIIGIPLLGLSYLWRSGDIIETMRSSNQNCVEFANDIYSLSRGKVSIMNDMRIGALTGGTINFGRQFLGDINLEFGSALNPAIQALATAVVDGVVSATSKEELKNTLTLLCCEKLDNTNVTNLDTRSRKILEELPEYIDKSCSSITKNTVNVGLKMAFSHILAGATTEGPRDTQYMDSGFNVYMSYILFNNSKANDIDEKVAKSLWKAKDDYAFNEAAVNGDIEKMKEILCSSLDNKADKSLLSKLFDLSKTIGSAILPVMFNSVIANMMTNNKAKWGNLKQHSKFYMPAGCILDIDSLLIDIDALAAVKELDYLLKAIDLQLGYQENLDDNSIVCDISNSIKTSSDEL